MSFREPDLPQKPSNCTCSFPMVIARNMNGHDPSCPVYQEWAKQLNPNSILFHTFECPEGHKIAIMAEASLEIGDSIISMNKDQIGCPVFQCYEITKRISK